MNYKPLLTYEDFPKDIAEALKRADAWQNLDRHTNHLTITSRNKEDPLTEKEKLRIAKYLVMRKHLYRRVSFRGPVEDFLITRGKER